MGNLRRDPKLTARWAKFLLAHPEYLSRSRPMTEIGLQAPSSRSASGLNLVFAYAFLLVPFLAIRPPRCGCVVGVECLRQKFSSDSISGTLTVVSADEQQVVMYPLT